PFNSTTTRSPRFLRMFNSVALMTARTGGRRRLKRALEVATRQAPRRIRVENDKEKAKGRPAAGRPFSGLRREPAAGCGGASAVPPEMPWAAEPCRPIAKLPRLGDRGPAVRFAA